ncbi:MAG: hypothetical protein AAB116_07730 [Candidatus Poribacteria bacterium]
MKSKILTTLIIIVFLCPLSAKANSPNTKTLGKLAMVGILSITAFMVKKLVDGDIDKTAKVRQNLGTVDKVMEFQDGFDQWHTEWHGNFVYTFKNGIFQHKEKS